MHQIQKWNFSLICLVKDMKACVEELLSPLYPSVEAATKCVWLYLALNLEEPAKESPNFRSGVTHTKGCHKNDASKSIYNARNEVWTHPILCSLFRNHNQQLLSKSWRYFATHPKSFYLFRQLSTSAKNQGGGGKINEIYSVM